MSCKVLKTIAFAALAICAVGFAPSASAQSVAYRYPTYKAAGDPKSGIKAWTTANAECTVVGSSTSAVTWGTSGSTTWYAVTGDVTITGGVTCQGYVNLILCNGAKLTVSGVASGKAGIATDASGSFTVYDQAAGAGTLDVAGGYGSAAIGGNQGANGQHITINGGIIKARACDQSVGSAQASGGVGIGGATSEGIYAADDALVKADNNNPPTTVIPHASITEDISGKLSGKRYATVEETARYRYPEYNTPGDPTSGIAAWKMGEKAKAEYTVVTSSMTTWGAEGATNWYVVAGDITIASRITCKGQVNLILKDGYTFTASKGITASTGTSVAPIDYLGFTIYAQSTDESTMGKLVATGGGWDAGIGGAQAAGSNITVNGGDVTATSDSGAGIGGGYEEAGSHITINGGKVKANAKKGAGIGGGYDGAGSHITVNDGTVTATSTVSGAGIGGGVSGAGSNIVINGGTVQATGNSFAAGIGSGSSGAVATNIFVSRTALAVKAGASSADTPIENGVGEDLAEKLAGAEHRYVVVTAGGSVDVGATNHGAISVAPAAWTNETVTITLTPEAGYEYNPGSLQVTAAGGAVPVTEVTAGSTYTFTMPASKVDVSASFRVVPASYLVPEYNTPGDPTSGIASWNVGTNQQYTYVTSDMTTWGAEGATNWYAVAGDVTISERITCVGDVRLILKDGATLTASQGITASPDTEGYLGFTVYAQSTDESTMGKLVATGSWGAAGIGGGINSSGSNITINGGVVTANGDRLAAGIGGGINSSGSNITINGGVVAATSTNYGYGAGIGGGQRGSGSHITINGGMVTATGGYDAGAGIGSGDQGGTSTDIFVDRDALAVKAGASSADTVIANYGMDLADALAGTAHRCAVVKAGGSIDTWAGKYATITTVPAAWTNETVTITLTPDEGYEYNPGSLQVTGAGGAVEVTEVEAGSTYTFTMPASKVDVSASFRVVPTSYLVPEYNTPGDPTSGIASWNVGTNQQYKYVTSSMTTWGAEGATNWYVVAGDITIASRITCKGQVNLILKDGATLTASQGITASIGTSVTPIDYLGFTVYAQSTDESTMGKLVATGAGWSAGIGGGAQAAGSNITINGGDVTATSDSGAGIGGGYEKAGSHITINGGKVKANAKKGAGIGGGFDGAGSHITVNDGTVTATSTVSGAGIGGGVSGAGSNIVINGGTVQATGNSSAAGIGSGSGGAVATNIFVNRDALAVKAGASSADTPIENRVGEDLATKLAGKEHCYAVVKAGGSIDTTAADHGAIAASVPAAWTNETVTITLTPDEGYEYNPGSLQVVGAGGAVEVTEVEAGHTYTFTMPASKVDVSASFRVVPASYLEPVYKTPGDPTSGIASWNVGTNQQYTYVTSASTAVTWGEANQTNWYVVAGDITIASRITCKGQVNLILKDGATLTASQGITASPNTSGYLGFTVYAQSTDEATMGKLVATSTIEGNAGIGGGDMEESGAAQNITINGGMVEANGSAGGAGIGGGGELGVAQYITLNGGTVTAIGGKYASGIGGGTAHNGKNITFNGGKVVAIGGAGAAGVGSGVHGDDSTDIFVNREALAVKAGASSADTPIPNDGMDLADALAGTAHRCAVVKAGGSIDTTAADHGAIAASVPAAWTNETVTITLTPAEGYEYAPGSLQVTGAGGTVEVTEVEAGHTYTFTMPASKVDVSASFRVVPTSYLYPEYKTPGDPTSGIAAWHEGTNQQYTVVTSSMTTWGAEGATNWYVVAGNVEISSRITCKGQVNLILKDGATLTASQGITASPKTSGYLGFTVYAQTTDEATMGKLVATGSPKSAGIGGGWKEAGSNITLNGGTVEATGGQYGAGIGGGNAYAGGTVAGCIGSNITLNGGTVMATGGESGAGIGGGNKGAAQNIAINGGTVTAKGGTSAAGIGSGRDGDDSTDIFVNREALAVKAGASSADTAIENDGGDLATALAGYSHSYATVTAGGSIDTEAADHGAIAASVPAAWTNETVTITLTPEAGYEYTPNSLKVTGAGGAVEVTEVEAGSVYTFTMPASKVDVSASFKVVPASYLWPEYNTPGDPTSGIAFWNVGTNQQYTYVTSASAATTWGAAGQTNWYVVASDVTISERITCKGQVNLILKDGAKLTASQGIIASSDTEGYLGFTVYAQSTDEATMGKLVAQGATYVAGIGGGSGCDGTNITLNGGTVTATGGTWGAGIGGGSGDMGVGSNITINGGKVEATSGICAAGIGGGYQGAAQNITINGGTVTATGSIESAGIGGGCGGNGSSITISGGTVTATGIWGSGIGGALGCAGSDIAISNATVFVCGVWAILEGEAYCPDCIGNGAGASSPASGIVIDSSAKVFFNLTGCMDGETGEWLDPIAPMPETFDGMTIMTPETPTNRVLVGGMSGLPGGQPLPFALTNAVTGATGTVTVNDAVGVLFADKILKLPYADNQLKLTVADPNPVAYREPVYNTPGDPTSGIASWAESECILYREVTSSMTTLGAAGQTNWYVVAGDITIGERITCVGDVRLILKDGATLTASAGITASTGTSKKPIDYLGFTVYAQSTDESTMGKLVATGASSAAGIGGGAFGVGSNITINGGTVEAASDTIYPAGIGGGDGGAGSNITINGGKVTATGNSGAGIGGGDGKAGSNITVNGGTVTAFAERGAGIGGGWNGAGSNIRINDGTVKATSNISGAGIGGGNAGAGSNITINGGDVTATSTNSGAGIGGGNGGEAQNITVNGGTVTATSNNYGAGIGGGANSSGSNITINGGTVTATGGSGAGGAAGIGSGTHGAAATDIYVIRTTLAVKAGASSADTAIANDGGDLATALSGYSHRCAVVKAGGSIDTEATEHGAISVAVAAWTNETVTITLTPEAGYEYAPGSLKVVDAAGNVVPVTEVEAGHTYTFTMPASKVDVSASFRVVPASYLVPEYNTPGDPTSGIASWNVGTNQQYTYVTSASTAVTWGAAGQTNWYVVAGNVTISERITCVGQVNLILKDGVTLTASKGIEASTGTSWAPIDYLGFTVYAQSTDESTMGKLMANGGGYAAGIGGGYGKAGSNITINGGDVTATGGSDAAGAGIGGGDRGAGSNITINGGKVTATSDSGAGIGGGSDAAGSSITVNGGTVEANAQRGAGIGGGYGKAGSHITINGGDVTATSTVSGAGIGGGVSGNGENIAINGGTVKATSGDWGAGIGGGYNGKGQYITINGGTVTATGGYDGGAGIGSGRDGTASSDIYVNRAVLAVKAGASSANTVIANDGTDLATALAGSAHRYAVVKAGGSIDKAATGPGEISVAVAAWTSETVTITLTPSEGYELAADTLKVVGAGGDVPVTEVEAGHAYTFTMPASKVDVSASFRVVPASYLWPEYNTPGDPTSGIASWNVGTNQQYTYVTSAMTTLGTAGQTNWYVVAGDVTISERITCVGDVRLILKNGATLTVSQGITASPDTEGYLGFTVYAQSTDEATMGRIIATGENFGDAGIGGWYDEGMETGHPGADITINGGTVTATGGQRSAGIGGAYVGKSDAGAAGSRITINGGFVTATGAQYGAGIGGGSEGAAQNITINGGTVMATGGDSAAGVGGGESGAGSNITINSGATVLVHGNVRANLIGSGNHGPAASDNSVASGAKVFFNLASAEAMPESFDGFTILTPETPVTRVLVGGIAAWTAETTFNLENAATAETATLAVNDAFGVLFSGKLLKLPCADNQLTLTVADQRPVSYLEPIYNVPGDPTRGVARWETAECLQYLEVTSDMTTLGTAGRTTWYVVAGDVAIDGRITCKGDVRLILKNGVTLTASAGITASTETEDYLGFTVYAQSIKEYLMGRLVATGVWGAAGIGGSDGVVGSNITLNGGLVTATGGYSAAGIGGGLRGAGSRITLNGGFVTAMGGALSAGIGGGYEGAGSNITIGNYATVRVHGNVYADLIGSGSGGSAASNNCILRRANILFGLASVEAMPDWCAGFMIMTPETAVDRRLVGGIANWTADTTFTLMREDISLDFKPVTINDAAGTPFSSKVIKLVHADSQLSLTVSELPAQPVVQDASGNPVVIVVPEEWREENGVLDEDAVDTENPNYNGLPTWQSYVLGLDPYDFSSSIYADSPQNTAADTVTIETKNIDESKLVEGYDIKYRLDTKLRGAGEYTKGTSQDDPDFDVKIDADDPTGVYKVNVVIFSNGVEIAQSAEAINIVGMLKQTQAITNAIISVPWGRLAPGLLEDIRVTNVVKTATLDEGDELRVYRPGSSTYEGWTLNANKQWVPSTTVAVNANGKAAIRVAANPTDATIPVGSGIWLCRKAANAGKPYYLYGQADGVASEELARGPNLIGATGIDNYDFNAHILGAEAVDKIIVPGSGDVPKVFEFKDGAWGYTKGTVVERTVAGRTIKVVTNVWTTDESFAAPGTGFWLFNNSGKIKVR